MKVLFIGGTGVISHACSELCIKRGYELFLLNRGKSFRKAPVGSNTIIADISNIQEVQSALKGKAFDVVVNWIAYKNQDVINDYFLFNNNISQYVFISSASVYKKPIERLPIKETFPVSNPFWKYSEDKIDCENYLLNKYNSESFPVTIVRPTHTYDYTKIPLHGGYTAIDRMKRDEKIIIHDSGTSLWTLTHYKDFAVGLVGLIGKQKSIGEIYNISSENYLTWNEIAKIIGNEYGISPDIIYVPSEYINTIDKEWGAGLLGDKAHSKIFDNSKIRNLVPEFKAEIKFNEGVKEIINWYNAKPGRQIVDDLTNKMMEKIIENYN